MAFSPVEVDKYRSFIYGDGEKNTQWRDGAPPNYDVVDRLFEEGRTQEWPVGSLEERVQRLVKSWEMEMVHKIRPGDFKTVNPNKFLFSLNGGKGITKQEIEQLGGAYNAFLQTTLPEEFRIFNPAQESAESSQKVFTTTFPRGFALEILQVYSGPPTIVYKFRHWGYMEGPFKGHPPTGERVEFHGMAIFHVDEHTRIEKVEFFFDRGTLLGGFLSGGSRDNPSATSSGCPFMEKK